MFDDRIEITSIGGLVSGVSKEEVLKGGISVLRNRIIGNIFLRFHMIEKLGTGMQRIHEEYKQSAKKPIIDISDNAMKMILPVIERDALSEDEKRIVQILKRRRMPSSLIIQQTGFGKTKVVSLLNQLVEKGYIVSTGNGRGKKYSA